MHDLPIVHDCVNFYKNWHRALINFPTSSRHTLGLRIDIIATEVAELLFSSVFAENQHRISIIKRVSIKFDSLKFLIRMAWEIKAIDNKTYAKLSEQLYNIGKQLGGWLKQLKSNFPE